MSPSRQKIYVLTILLIGVLLFPLIFAYRPAPVSRPAPSEKDRATPETTGAAFSPEWKKYWQRFFMSPDRDDRDRPGPRSPFEIGEPRANIGFGRLLSDGEVLDWLEAHDAEPRAFFMHAPGGFNGTHRLYEDEDKSMEEVLAEARADTIQAFESSLDSSLIRLHRFAERYTGEEVAANEDLEESARSLLHLRSAFTAARDGAEQGAPLIYSVEVAGEVPVLGQLQEDQTTGEFHANLADPAAGTVQRTVNPFAEHDPYLDPFVQDMDVEDVYQEIKELGAYAPEVSMTDLQGTDLQKGK